MHRTILYLALIVCLCFSVLRASAADGGPRRVLDDTDRNATNVGNIGLTITNFGTIGSRNSYWPSQPSCEYPRGSRIEHIYQGGLWVGAVSRISGQQLVSTGATDRSSASRIGQGYELTSEPGSVLIERSSLPQSQTFDPAALSHQDFLAEYTDRNRTNPTTGDTIPAHTPLGISVSQRSYAWNFPFADFFVLLSYTVRNTGLDTLDSVYIGFWNNAVVRNTNNVRPGTSGYFDNGASGYVDSLRMMYSFDYDGLPTPPAADSYVAIKLLGATPFPNTVASLDSLGARTHFNAWRFRNSVGDVAYFSPDDDAEAILGARSRFDRLASSLAPDKIAPLRTRRDNMTTLLSVGPFTTLAPGDSQTVVFAVVCARKQGSAPANLDTPEQRARLVTHAGFAQQAYDGEDGNGNNILDPGEDLNGNGVLDRFQLPQPPRPPKVRAELADRNVVLYWDKANAELSVDPITRDLDFEGYRVYRSNAGADFTRPEDFLLNLPLVGEFDVPGNGVGYETGFRSIALDRAKTFPGDTVQYWYRFPPEGSGFTHLSGWQYVYGVAAFDRGDSASGVAPLQSATVIQRVVPGSAPGESGQAPVRVYPNPYYAGAQWDGSGERNRKLYFTNLPARCEITITTLAGDVVDRIVHDAATYAGTDIEWFRRFGGTDAAVRFSGGEHAWDFISTFDQAIATGLYLFTVRDSDTGAITRGKFLVIK